MTMTPEQAVSWSAGIIEGEGCVTRQITTKRSKAYNYWVISVSSTDIDVLERLQGILKVGSIYKQKTGEKHKQAWQLRIYRQAEVLQTLYLLLPFMCLRRSARIREALASMTSRLPYREGRREILIGKTYSDLKLVKPPDGDDNQ